MSEPYSPKHRALTFREAWAEVRKQWRLLREDLRKIWPQRGGPRSYDGITSACGFGVPPGYPVRTHGLCFGCRCPCHRSDNR